MLAVKELFLLVLVVTVCITMAAPKPDKSKGQHTRVVIHTPIKFHTIHHTKVHKIPVHLKKTIHHHGKPGLTYYANGFGGWSNPYKGWKGYERADYEEQAAEEEEGEDYQENVDEDEDAYYH